MYQTGLGEALHKSVLAILQHRLEEADEKAAEKDPLPEHENVRGAHYYH